MASRGLEIWVSSTSFQKVTLADLNSLWWKGYEIHYIWEWRLSMFHTLDTNLCGWANSKDRKSDNQLFSICLVLPNMVGQITHPARAYPRALLMMSFTSHFNEYLEIQREFNLKITWVIGACWKFFCVIFFSISFLNII